MPILFLFSFFFKCCLLQATTTELSSYDRNCIFPKLKYLLSGLLQKKFAYAWSGVSAVYSTHRCGKEKVNDEWRSVCVRGGEALTVVGEMNASSSCVSTHSGKIVKKIQRFLSSICFRNISEYYH